MPLKEEITIAAILGAGRQPFRAPPAEGALGVLLAQLAGRDSEETLLTAAGLVGAYERAGTLPARTDEPLPDAASADTIPVVSAAAGEMLAQMLGGSRREILVEALSLMADRGRRAPEPLLPVLLDLGERSAEYRRRVVPVLGARGRWLAGLNDAWEYARGVDPSAVPGDTAQIRAIWEESGRDARASLLRHLREQDPQQARVLLESTWKSDPAEHRALFTAILAEGLSMDDEPFLESALDDRSKEVRRAAAETLARLPESALAGRMWERAKPLLAIVGGSAGGLAVLLPDGPDTAAIRDGIDPAARLAGLGDRASLLAQTISAVAPHRWEEALDASPEQLLMLAQRTEWADALIVGWIRGANRTANASWLELLIRYFLASPKVKSWSPENLPDIDLLPESVAENVLADALRDGAADDSNPVWTLLPRYRRSCGLTLSRALLDAIRARVAARPQDAWSLGRYLHDLALKVPPTLADLDVLWPENEAAGYLKTAVEEFRSILEFRRDLWKELER